jgi:hypothetical protein
VKKIPDFTEESLAVGNAVNGEFILVKLTRKRGVSYYITENKIFIHVNMKSCINKLCNVFVCIMLH